MTQVGVYCSCLVSNYLLLLEPINRLVLILFSFQTIRKPPACTVLTLGKGYNKFTEVPGVILRARVQFKRTCSRFPTPASRNCHAMLLTAGNQELMAAEGGIDMLVVMLTSPHPHLQRQASKALANLGVNAGNKKRICDAGGVPPLVKLAASKSQGVAVEAIAALANLAVNGERG